MTCTGCAEARALRRTRAAACMACVGNAAKCRYDLGATVEVYIKGEKACPRGWHPDANGRVRWGWRWYGLPFPLRMLAAWKWMRTLPGCGCVSWAKDLLKGDAHDRKGEGVGAGTTGVPE